MSEFNNENLFSKRLRAGKRRTYFFDVRSTKNQDYFVTLTESKKRFNGDGYERHKIFLYKEDFNKFIAALTETIDYVKTELMPDFDFDSFNHDENSELNQAFGEKPSTTVSPEPASAASTPPPSEPITEVSENKEPEVAAPIEQVASNETAESPAENPTRNEEAQEW